MTKETGKWETGPPVMIATYMGHFDIVKHFKEVKETKWQVRDETYSKRNILHALMDMELITEENKTRVRKVKA